MSNINKQVGALFLAFALGVSAGIGAKEAQAQADYVTHLENERDCILINGTYTIDLDGHGTCNIDIVEEN